jgi:pyruvate,water dikinase
MEHGMSDEKWCIDTGLAIQFPVYTRFNANDVLPDPITPLGASMFWNPEMFPGGSLAYAELGSATAVEAIENEAWPFGAFCYGYLYVNVTMARLVGIRSGIGWEGIDAAFFGSHPDAPTHKDLPTDINPELSQKIADRTTWTLTTSTFPELDEETRIADGLRASRPDFSTLTNAALVAYARSMMPYSRLMWRGEVVAGSQAAIGPAVVMSILGPDNPVNVVDITGPAGDVVSAMPSYALWDMSRLVRASAPLTKAFDEGIEGLNERLRANHPDFAQHFAAFIREFGYRGPSEWDMGADSWETKPELALSLLDRMRQLDDADSPSSKQAAHAAATDKAMMEATAGMDAATEAAFRGAIGSARRFAGWRESGKSSCIKIMNEARMALIELGERLAAKGVLDHSRQIFIALDEELDSLALEETTLRPVLAQREKEWNALKELEVPTFLDGSKPIPPISEVPRKGANRAEKAAKGTILTGAAASTGIVEGVARVITGTDAISEFQPGEILVAPQTDPSWTPLFMVASAVIVDTGSMGSHAMIVARELGIPCVAGLPKATEMIGTGTRVRVDGAAGTVEIL